MIVSVQRKALNLTGQILRELWDGNTKRMITYITADTTLMDSSCEQQFQGVDQILAYLRNGNYGILKGDIVQPDFRTLQLSQSLILVNGTYTVQSVPGSLKRFTQRHQLTVIWEESGDQMLIRHFHSSLMDGDSVDQVKTPSVEGTHNYTTMLKKIRDERAVYPITDHKGRRYLLESADILTIESDRNYIIVTRADGEPDITVRMPFKDFMKQMPEQLVVITRGKAVNFDYVQSLHRNTLNLVDGSQHSVSRLYIPTVKNKITNK